MVLFKGAFDLAVALVVTLALNSDPCTCPTSDAMLVLESDDAELLATAVEPVLEPAVEIVCVTVDAEPERFGGAAMLEWYVR